MRWNHTQGIHELIPKEPIHLYAHYGIKYNHGMKSMLKGTASHFVCNHLIMIELARWATGSSSLGFGKPLPWQLLGLSPSFGAQWALAPTIE
jgi:hypothetical protein